MSKLKKAFSREKHDDTKHSPPPSSHDASHELNSTSAAYLKVLKDYSLLMEYKRLEQQSPTGVYVLPSSDSLRRWYGVIFIRKGHYRGGIFKFVLLIPTTYPDDAPRVHFLSEMFHPLIHPDTGALDITLQFPKWSANQHYIVLLLCYIKKIFYKTEFWEPRKVLTTGTAAGANGASAATTATKYHEAFNPKAQSLWQKNKDEYIQLCEKISAKSQLPDKLYHQSSAHSTEDAKNSIQFERPRPAHEEIHRRIVNEDMSKGLSGDSFLQWFEPGVLKLDSAAGADLHTPPTYYVHHAPQQQQDMKHHHEMKHGVHVNHASSSSSSAASASASSSAAGHFSPISPVSIVPHMKAVASAAAATAVAAANVLSDATTEDDTPAVTMEQIQP